MPRRPATAFEPRKSPVQARSTASVDAMLQATIQVLLQVGKERLTTTRVAARAGVSVGTLYQYFPNKSALLQAVLKRHLDGVLRCVATVCVASRGACLQQMAASVISAFLAAKMKDVKTSVALYSVSADVDGARIGREIGNQCIQAIAETLTSAAEPLTIDPELAATVLYAAMVGVARKLLDAPAPEKQSEALQRELITMATAYLEACTVRLPDPLASHAAAGARTGV